MICCLRVHWCTLHAYRYIRHPNDISHIDSSIQSQCNLTDNGKNQDVFIMTKYESPPFAIGLLFVLGLRLTPYGKSSGSKLKSIHHLFTSAITSVIHILRTIYPQIKEISRSSAYLLMWSIARVFYQKV